MNELNSKRKKRKTNYHKIWEDSYKWLKSSFLGDDYAECTSCNCSFKISNGGIFDVKRHESTPKHAKSVLAKKACNIENFSMTNNTKIKQKILAAEITYVYHSVVHSHSYNSMSCSSGLFNNIFQDSKIAS